MNFGLVSIAIVLSFIIGLKLGSYRVRGSIELQDIVDLLRIDGAMR